MTRGSCAAHVVADVKTLPLPGPGVSWASEPLFDGQGVLAKNRRRQEHLHL